jgi:hypothetical protein
MLEWSPIIFWSKPINCYKSLGALCNLEMTKVSNAEKVVFGVIMVSVHFWMSVDSRYFCFCVWHGFFCYWKNLFKEMSAIWSEILGNRPENPWRLNKRWLNKRRVNQIVQTPVAKGSLDSYREPEFMHFQTRLACMLWRENDARMTAAIRIKAEQ